VHAGCLALVEPLHDDAAIIPLRGHGRPAAVPGFARAVSPDIAALIRAEHASRYDLNQAPKQPEREMHL
jgi:hypothetical protein